MLSNILYVIGNNKYGELGLNHTQNLATLTNWNRINHMSIKHISNGTNHTIFIDSHNNYFSAGRNTNGQCACHSSDKCITSPIYYITIKKIQKVCTSIGDNNNTFWITNNNTLYGNGENEYFQLGIVPSKAIYTPTKMKGLTEVIDVRGGRYHNIALCGVELYNHTMDMIIHHCCNQDRVDRIYIAKEIVSMIKRYHHSNNKVYSTGDPEHCNYGQNGHGSSCKDAYGKTNYIAKNKWIIVEALRDKSIMKIACGAYYSLFLAENGELFACGSNNEGALGMGSKKTDKFSPPQRIELFVTLRIFVMEIRCGFSHNLCVDSEGKVWCWGLNMFGQCGDGTTTNVNIPKIIETLKEYNVVDIKCGFWHSYAKIESGCHYLFGHNVDNQCSLGENDKYHNVVSVPYCIDGVFSKITKGKKIKDVFLGNRNTFILSE